MFSLDHQRALADAPARLGLTVTPERRGALQFLLARLEQDPRFTMIRQLAYVLATIRWETAGTFLPIRERRASRERSPRLWELQNRYWRTGFYGRGYVQITWEDNYRLAGRRLAGQTFTLDGRETRIEPDTFVRHPDIMLHPDVAYLVCARGMLEGWFTGRRLDHYIREGLPPDYVNARRIVNGLDHAHDIAAMANQFELLLRASSTPVPVPQVAVIT